MADRRRDVTEWLERRFPWGGLLDDRTDPSLGLRVVTARYVPSIVNIAFLAVVFGVYDRPAMSWLNGALAMVYLVVLAITAAVPGSGLAALVGLWASLVVHVAGHVVMGGYGYSGGFLLFGAVIVVQMALTGSRRGVSAITATYMVVAVVLAFVESDLRRVREAPDVALPTIVIVDVFLVSILILGPLVVSLVARIKTAEARTRELLLTILPESVVDRLQDGPTLIADRFEQCTIVFADLVGFTAHARGRDPAEVVSQLNTIFSRFDEIAADHGAEKIKTIGDGYMVACGLPDPDPHHTRDACDLALTMLESLPDLNEQLGTDFRLRVGVNTGSAVAGVVGTSKFSYDVWGDTVNTASRLESNGSPGAVTVSAAVVDAVQAAGDGRLGFESLGTRDLKGQGPTPVFRLTRRDLTTAASPQ